VTLVPSQTDHNRQLHELAAVAPGGTERSRTLLSFAARTAIGNRDNLSQRELILEVRACSFART